MNLRLCAGRERKLVRTTKCLLGDRKQVSQTHRILKAGKERGAE
jgi:hypothetical protein